MVDYYTRIYAEMRPKQYAVGAIHTILTHVRYSDLTEREKEILALVISAMNRPDRRSIQC